MGWTFGLTGPSLWQIVLIVWVVYAAWRSADALWGFVVRSLKEGAYEPPPGGKWS